MAWSWMREPRKRWIVITLAMLWVLEMGLLVWYVLPDDAGAPPPATPRDAGIAADAELPVVAPSATSTPMVPSTSTPTPTSRATMLAQTYPTTVDAYARAALNAWLAGDGGGLADLASAEAVKTVGKAPAGLAGGWQFYACKVEPIKPCRQLRNNNGDIFSVSVDRARLGQPRAVTAAYRDLTRYEGSSLEYLYRGIDAWNAANSERIAVLTDGQGGWIFTTMSARGDHKGFHDYVEFASTIDPDGRTCIQAWDSTGTSWLWAVDKRRLGKPRAIVWAGGEQVC